MESQICKTCKGAGEITYDMPAISETWKCRDCNGKGFATQCVICGKSRPEPPPGPPNTPGDYYCVNHRHLKPRTIFG